MKTIYEFLEEIKQRPGMYLRDSNITTLHDFLNGYFFALDENKIAHQELPDFHDFSDWVARYHSYYEGTAGWAHIILLRDRSVKRYVKD